jgi:hypothetical protein
LEEVLELAQPGQRHLINRHRGLSQNLHSTFCRIVKRAGVSPWTKAFQNLRATRETGFAAEYPLHVVCAWIGNSERVANKHCLQVTDDYYKRAAQNPAQPGAARDGQEVTSSGTASLKSADLLLQSVGVNCCQAGPAVHGEPHRHSKSIGRGKMSTGQQTLILVNWYRQGRQ